MLPYPLQGSARHFYNNPDYLPLLLVVQILDG